MYLSRTVGAGSRPVALVSRAARIDPELHTEPSLCEVLRDPVIRKRMAVDGVRTRDVLKIVASYRKWRRKGDPSLLHGRQPKGEVSERPYETAWEIDCRIGHPVLDAQHRELVALFYEGPPAQGDRNCGKELLNRYRELLEGIRDHYRTAEQVMRETDFAGIEQHILEHRVLLVKAEVVERRLKKNPEDEATRALAWRLLWKLVIGHIQHGDSQLRHHLSKR